MIERSELTYPATAAVLLIELSRIEATIKGIPIYFLEMQVFEFLYP